MQQWRRLHLVAVLGPLSLPPYAAAHAQQTQSVSQVTALEGQGTLLARMPNRDRGEPRGSRPPLPPDVRARLRRCGGLGGGVSPQTGVAAPAPRRSAAAARSPAWGADSDATRTAELERTPHRGWRTAWWRAHASRVSHTSSPVPVRRPASLRFGSLRTPPRGGRPGLCLACGSAAAWHGDSPPFVRCHVRHTRCRSAAGGAGPLERRVMRPYSTRGHASGKPLIAGPRTPRRTSRRPGSRAGPSSVSVCTSASRRLRCRRGTTDQHDSQLFGTFT